MWQIFSPRPLMALPLGNMSNPSSNLFNQGNHDSRGVLKFALQCAPFCMLNQATLLARFYSVKCMGHFVGRRNYFVKVPEWLEAGVSTISSGST